MSTSSPDLSLLYTPVQLGAWHLPNRLIAGAMTRNRGIIPTPLNAAYYAQRARHAGLIISEGILIEPQGCEWPYAPGLFNQEQVEGWRVVTDAVHREGGLIIAQLWHVGRLAHPLHQAGQPAAAPSAVAAKGGKFRLLPGYTPASHSSTNRTMLRSHTLRLPSCTRLSLTRSPNLPTVLSRVQRARLPDATRDR